MGWYKVGAISLCMSQSHVGTFPLLKKKAISFLNVDSNDMLKHFCVKIC